MRYNLDIRNKNKEIYSGHLNFGASNPQGDSIAFTNYYMTFNGKPAFPISGEFHFSRYDSNFWEEEIMKIKACGLNIVAAYLFWIHHEFVEGEFNFSKNCDIRRFVRLCEKHKLHVLLRIGPYAHGECRNGGLPDWLFGRPFEVRTNDERYLSYVKRYFKAIGEQVSDLMFTNGGNMIAIQIENEFMSASSPWEITVTQNREWITSGRDGLSHMNNLKAIAEKEGLKSAFYTCTAWGDAPYPDGEMLPVWGGYAYWPWLFWEQSAKHHPPTGCYVFSDRHDGKHPFACCEMGGGMQVWYQYRFVVEPESVEAMNLVTIASGANFIGYYMFHGGRNPVINNVFTNEQWNPRIAYDFQAPLSDSGLMRESYKRIKLIHYLVKDLEEQICGSFSVIPPGQELIEATDSTKLRYAARTNGKGGFLFLNNYQDHFKLKDQTDIKFEINADGYSYYFPKYNGFNINGNDSCVMLFGMDLHGLTLEYATAQYITKIQDVNFFFVHEGCPGEICFGRNYEVVSFENVSIENDSDKLLIVVPSDRISTFSLRDESGNIVSFCCLDRINSLNFWIAELNGIKYAVLTQSNVYYSDDSIYLESVGLDNFEVSFYPELEFENVLNGTISPLGTHFCLHKYLLETKLPDISYKLETPYNNRAVLKFNAEAIEDLSELYLKIEYDGNIGWAFIDGKLVHDDFNNGMNWIIGLKNLSNSLKEHDLYIYISEGKSEVPVIIDENCKTGNFNQNQAKFKSVELIPEKTLVIR